MSGRVACCWAWTGWAGLGWATGGETVRKVRGTHGVVVQVPIRWAGLASVAVRRMDSLFVHSFVSCVAILWGGWKTERGCVYNLHPYRSFGHRRPSPHIRTHPMFNVMPCMPCHVMSGPWFRLPGEIGVDHGMALVMVMVNLFSGSTCLEGG